eukprot:TRINITY_DN73075_c0_g1_i1.p1 TRINITY_DN73075_c0_g1~~TRINITY_DN73075_c0_g1_i1.p1  ORF type:complete len:185 (-),score=6.84 TRINITY_DN73075_c0_g1_i1:124-678(-)
MSRLHIFPAIFRLPPVIKVPHANLRQFSSCAVMQHKEIVMKEENNKIIVEGKHVESPRTKYLVACEQSGGQSQCHPFCKSSIASQVKHTDVLILDQFVDPKGELYTREDMGICERQWVRLRKLVEMAQRSGLMPGKEFYCKDYRQTKWGSQNCYWDEKTIDIQWNRNKQLKKIQYYTKGLGKKP